MNKVFAVAALGLVTAVSAPAFAVEKQDNQTACLQFSAAQQKTGSSIMAVTDTETGTVREIEYTNWYNGLCNDSENAKWTLADSITVYEGPAANIKYLREGAPHKHSPIRWKWK